MSGFMFVNPENLPPEIRAQIEMQHDLHHMSHQQHIHEVNDFFRSLNKEQMNTLHTLVGHIIDGTQEDNERGAYYLGRLSEHLMIRHGVCICGVDHDAEAKEMLAKESAEVPPMPKTREDAIRLKAESALEKSGTNWTEAQKILIDGIHRFAESGNWTQGEITAALEDGMKMLSEIWPNQAAEPEPKVDQTDESITYTDHNEVKHTWKGGAWVMDQPTQPTQQQAEVVGEAREALLKEYNVLDIPLQFPKVTCAKDCGRRWISLVDRMRRAPGECDGCQQKSAWG